MAHTLPPEINIHQNRISVEIQDLFKDILEGKFTAEKSVQIGRLMWNIVRDPVYESDQELRYLASKIGVIVGQYDVAIKSMDENISGTLVWGSVALFEIGEIDQAFENLHNVIENEINDYIPLIEAIVLIVYLKTLIGDTENIENYCKLLEDILESRKSRLIPAHLKQLSVFVKGIVEIYTSNAITGYESIETFYKYCKEKKDQYWQLIALLVKGEQKLDSSDFISSEKIYQEAKALAVNLGNEPLLAAVEIGASQTLYLKGKLKESNILITQTIKDTVGKTQYYLGKAYQVKGKVLSKLGQHRLAREHFIKAKAFAQKYRDHNRMLLSLLSIADDYVMVNEMAKAKEVYDKAYNQVANIANKRQFAQALVEIALGDFYQGDLEKALKRVERIETLSEEISYQKGKTDAIKLRAQFNIERNINLPKQIQALLACQILYLEVGDEVSSANCDILIAKAFIRLGSILDAQIYLERAKEYYLRISDNLRIAEIKELQAEFDINDGRYDEALVRLRSSYSHYSDIFDSGGRIRCLRKIADTLGLKGDHDEAIARYEKVSANIDEELNEIEYIVICFNSARINHSAGKIDKAVENYNVVSKFLLKNNLECLNMKLLEEKAYMLTLANRLDQLSETTEELNEGAKEQGTDLNPFLMTLEGIKLIQESNYDEASNILMSNLQESLTKENKLVAISLLFNVLHVIVLKNDNLKDELTAEEMRNYLNLLRSIVIEADNKYLIGVVSLLEIIWSFINPNYKNMQMLITEAAEHFASTGIEELANLSLIIQHNINEWEGIADSKIKQILVSPKIYDTPNQLLEEILLKGKRSLFLEKVKDTEKEIVTAIYKKEEQ